MDGRTPDDSKDRVLRIALRGKTAIITWLTCPYIASFLRMNEILRDVDKNHDCSYSSIYRLPLEFRKAVQHEKTRMMESLTIKLSPE